MNARLYPDAEETVMAKLSAYADDADVIITAHTHYSISLKRGNLQIINPGSVGQPRQREKHDGVRANWALYDTDLRSVLLMTTTYDATALLEAIDKTDPDVPFLRDVLLRST